MAVVGVFIDADIGDDEHLGNRRLDFPDRPLNDAVGIISLGPAGVFFAGNPKKKDRRDAEGMTFFHLLHQVVDGIPVNPRHGGYFLSFAPPFANEQGGDQVVHRQVGLTNQPQKSRVLSQPPVAVNGKGHEFPHQLKPPRGPPARLKPGSGGKKE